MIPFFTIETLAKRTLTGTLVNKGLVEKNLFYDLLNPNLCLIPPFVLQQVVPQFCMRIEMLQSPANCVPRYANRST